jgi:hypothetical protein
LKLCASKLVSSFLAELLAWVGSSIATSPYCRSSTCSACAPKSSRVQARRDASVRRDHPCRSKRGNIEAAIERLPRFAPRMEVVFVEGSFDRLHVSGMSQGAKSLRRLLGHQGAQANRQGQGRRRVQGFDAAIGDILMILDADLTVPPEALPKSYAAITTDGARSSTGPVLYIQWSTKPCAPQFYRQWAVRRRIQLSDQLALHRYSVRHQGIDRYGLSKDRCAAILFR